MLKRGIKKSIIAEKYSVSNTLIWNIANGNRWASVTIEEDTAANAVFFIA